MTPGTGILVLGWPYKSYREIALFLSKSFSILSQALISQKKYILMMTKEGSTKIVNFIQVITVNMYYLLLYQYTSIEFYYVTCKGL